MLVDIFFLWLYKNKFNHKKNNIMFRKEKDIEEIMNKLLKDNKFVLDRRRSLFICGYWALLFTVYFTTTFNFLIISILTLILAIIVGFLFLRTFNKKYVSYFYKKQDSKNRKIFCKNHLQIQALKNHLEKILRLYAKVFSAEIITHNQKRLNKIIKLENTYCPRG